MLDFNIFTLDSITELFLDKEIEEKAVELYPHLNEPKFHIKETGIHSKLIGDWEKAGLISYESEKRKWRSFSFIEVIWVKFIGELRYYGMPLEEVKTLKEELFPKTSTEIRTRLEEISEIQGPDYFKPIQENLKEGLKGDEMVTTLAENSFSIFGTMVLIALIEKSTIAFYNDRESNCFINLGKPVDEINAQKQNEVFWNMQNTSFSMINISNLINKFFDNEKLDAAAEFYFSIMDAEEKEVIQAIRTGNYKQITIKMDNGAITQLRLAKKQDEEMIKKISRILKKGDYKEIHLNVRDGIPVKLEVTDIIKIKKQLKVLNESDQL